MVARSCYDKKKHEKDEQPLQQEELFLLEKVNLGYKRVVANAHLSNQVFFKEKRKKTANSHSKYQRQIALNLRII